ncbi:MAG: 30S ribosomal protein S17 [Thermomicrobiales bacterium]|nr:30S ribosomal protein S17 [Thermomicrobiales bacterium]
MSEVQETTATEVEERHQASRTQKVGTVVSDKMEKTVVVSVDFVRRHPLYNKRITRTNKFFAHDENGVCKIGDTVRIEECAPISKRKRWIVREVLERAVQV